MNSEKENLDKTRLELLEIFENLSPSLKLQLLSIGKIIETTQELIIDELKEQKIN